MLKSFLKLNTMTFVIRLCVSQSCSALPLRSSPGFGIVLILLSPISQFTLAVLVCVGLGVGVGLGFNVGLGVGLGVGVGLGLAVGHRVGLGFGVGVALGVGPGF